MGFNERCVLAAHQQDTGSKDDKDSKDDDDKEPKDDEADKKLPIKPSPLCKKITGLESAGCFSNSFYGSVADGFSLETFKQGSDKLMSMLNVVNALGLVPAEFKPLYTKCLPKFKKDICETILPRCSDTCQPLQSCKKSCEELQKECIPANLIGMLKQVLPGGTFRGMIGMVGLSEGSPAMKMLDAWVGKMSTCKSSFLSKSNDVCLTSDYNRKACDPEDYKEPEDKDEDEDKDDKEPKDDDEDK